VNETLPVVPFGESGIPVDRPLSLAIGPAMADAITEQNSFFTRPDRP